jgi:hypothetical protein
MVLLDSHNTLRTHTPPWGMHWLIFAFLSGAKKAHAPSRIIFAPTPVPPAPTCEVCEEDDATLHCTDGSCDTKFCGECFDVSHRKGTGTKMIVTERHPVTIDIHACKLIDVDKNRRKHAHTYTHAHAHARADAFAGAKKEHKPAQIVAPSLAPLPATAPAPTCEVCEENPATLHCADGSCDTDLCEECFGVSHRKGTHAFSATNHIMNRLITLQEQKRNTGQHISQRRHPHQHHSHP